MRAIRWVARVALVATASMTGLAGLASPASADQVPGATATPVPDPAPGERWGGNLTVSPLEALPGGTAHVSGECQFFGHGGTGGAIFFRIRSQNLSKTAFFLADPATPAIDLDITVPADLPPGVVDLSWACYADDQVFAWSIEDVPFTVLDPGPRPLTTPAPSTAPLNLAQPSTTAPETSAPRRDELAETGSLVPGGPLAVAALIALAGGAASSAALLRFRAGRRRT